MLRGQVAVIVGAAGGVGRAAAVALAREHADVVVAGIREERLVDTAKAVAEHGGRVISVPCDVTDEEQIASMFARCIREFGRLDIVVNSAVWADPPGSILEMPRAVWEKTMAVDLTGTFLLSQHALRSMLPRKTGRLILISSEVAKRGSAMRGAYAAAKAGVNSLVQSFVLATAGTDIKVNAICPMGIAGEHNKAMRALFADLQGVARESDAAYEAVRATMMQPEDVAALVVFLASPAGLRINGQAMTIGEASSSGGPTGVPLTPRSP